MDYLSAWINHLPVSFFEKEENSDGGRAEEVELDETETADVLPEEDVEPLVN